MLNERLSEMTHNSYSNHNDSIWNETCCGWFESINRSTVNHYYLYPLSYKQEHSNKHTSYWNHHSSFITKHSILQQSYQSLQSISMHSYSIWMMHHSVPPYHSLIHLSSYSSSHFSLFSHSILPDYIYQFESTTSTLQIVCVTENYRIHW